MALTSEELPRSVIPTWLSIGGLVLPPLALVGLIWGLILISKTGKRRGIFATVIGALVTSFWIYVFWVVINYDGQLDMT
jgi:cellulose synthase/poly-beta-1,6-N-acetylglucosamine synthase-like glycosyltransferase